MMRWPPPSTPIHACAQAGTSTAAGYPAGHQRRVSTKDVETTCGSKILRATCRSSPRRAVERLQAAGMVMLGKLNMDEFAMGSSTENSRLLRRPATPGIPTRVPGGSSGGSAAAVASGMAAGALGTDTGGSIRQPAAFCGITALKPSYGRVSRYGLVAFGSSLDCPGAAGALGGGCGAAASGDGRARSAGFDQHAGRRAGLRWPALTGDIKGLKVGIPKEYFIEGIEPDVEEAVRAAIAQLEAWARNWSRSACRIPITACRLITSSPRRKPAPIWPATTACASVCASTKARCGRPTKPRAGRASGAEVKRRIMIGTYALSAGYYDAYYGKAQAVRTLIKQDFDRAFEQVDVIAAPIAPTTAFKIGENTDDPLQMYLQDVFTLPAIWPGCRAEPALRLRPAESADWDAIDRPGLRRSAPAADRSCLRTGHRLAYPTACTAQPINAYNKSTLGRELAG